MTKVLLVMYLSIGVHVIPTNSMEECRAIEETITHSAIATECQFGETDGDTYAIKGAGAAMPKM